MEENRLRSAFAGAIIGFILGMAYYNWPASCLITGTMRVDGLFMPAEVHSRILQIGLKWGGGVGALIGLLGGLSCSIRLPRGHMSKAISCTTCLVCVILAFVMHGRQLALMSAGRIAMTFGYVIMLFLLAVPIGAAISFIEKIRE